MAEAIRLSVFFDVQGEAKITQGAARLDVLSTRFQQLITNAGNYNRAFQMVINQTNRAASIMHTRLGASLGVVNRLFEETFHTINRLIRYGFYKLALEVGTVSYALRGLFKEFININEQFAGLQITLKSAFQSAQAARQIREELVKITALSPVPLEDLAAGARSVAVVPQLSKQIQVQIQQGTLGDQEGFFRRYMRLIEQMLAFRPDKQVKDVIFSIREAATGELRSLIRRFDFPPGLLVSASGRSISELRQDPVGMVNAIKAAMDRIITPQAVKELAFLPSKLADNLQEQLLKIPLLRIGDAGFFKTFTGFFDRLYTRVSDFTQGEFDKPTGATASGQSFAKEISDNVETLFFTIIQQAKGLSESLLSKIGFGQEDRPDLTYLERLYGSVASAAEKAAEGLPKVIDRAKQFFQTVSPMIATLSRLIMNGLELFTKFVSDSPLRLVGAYSIWRSLPALFSRAAGAAAGRVTARSAAAQAAIGEAGVRLNTPVSAGTYSLNQQGYFLTRSGNVTQAAQSGLNRAATSAAQAAAAAATSATLGTGLNVGGQANQAAIRSQNAVAQALNQHRQALLARFGNVTVNPNNPNMVSWTPNSGGRSMFVNTASGQFPSSMTAYYQRGLSQYGYMPGHNVTQQYVAANPVPTNQTPGRQANAVRILTPAQMAAIRRQEEQAARASYRTLLQTARNAGAGGITGRIGAAAGTAALALGTSSATAASVTAGATSLAAIASSVIVPLLVIVAGSYVVGKIAKSVSTFLDSERAAAGKRNFEESSLNSKNLVERQGYVATDVRSYQTKLIEALGRQGLRLDSPELGKFLVDFKNRVDGVEFGDFQKQLKLATDVLGDSIDTQKFYTRTLVETPIVDPNNQLGYATSPIYTATRFDESGPIEVTLDQLLTRAEKVNTDIANLGPLMRNEIKGAVKLVSTDQPITADSVSEARKLFDILDLERRRLDIVIPAISRLTGQTLGISYQPTLSQKDQAQFNYVQNALDVFGSSFNDQVGFIRGALPLFEEFQSALQTYKVPEARASIVAGTESYFKGLQQEYAYGETTAAAFAPEEERIAELSRLRQRLTGDQGGIERTLATQARDLAKKILTAAQDPDFVNKLLPGLDPDKLIKLVEDVQNPKLQEAVIRDFILSVDDAMTTGFKERLDQVAMDIDKGLSAIITTDSQVEVDRVKGIMNEGIESLYTMAMDIARASQVPTSMQDKLVKQFSLFSATLNELATIDESVASDLKPGLRVGRSEKALTAIDDFIRFIENFKRLTGQESLAPEFEDNLQLLRRSQEALYSRNQEAAEKQGQGLLERDQRAAFSAVLGVGGLALDTEFGQKELDRNLGLFKDYMRSYYIQVPETILDEFRQLSEQNLSGDDLRIATANLKTKLGQAITESASNALADQTPTTEKVKRLTDPVFANLFRTILESVRANIDEAEKAYSQQQNDIRRKNAAAYQDVISGNLFPSGFGAVSQEAQRSQLGGYQTYLGTFGVKPPSQFDLDKLGATPATELERINQTKSLFDTNLGNARAFQAQLDTGLNPNGTRMSSEQQAVYQQQIADSWQRAQNAARGIADYLSQVIQDGEAAFARLSNAQFNVRGTAGPILLQRDTEKAQNTLLRRGYNVPPGLSADVLSRFDTSYVSGQAAALETSRETLTNLISQAESRRNVALRTGATLQAEQFGREYEDFLLQLEQVEYALEGIKGKGNDVFASWADGFGRVTDQWYATAGNLTQIGEQMAGSLSSSFGGAWGSWVSGSQSGEEAFKQFYTSVLNGWSQMLMQKAFEGVLGLVFNSIGFGGVSSGPSTAGLGGFAGATGVIPAAPAAATASFSSLAGFSGGGMVPGTPSPVDSVPILASPGEVIIPTKTVQSYGKDHFAQYFPSSRRFSEGGIVGDSFDERPSYTKFNERKSSVPTLTNSPVSVNVTINQDGSSKVDVNKAGQQAKELGAQIQLLVKRTMMEEKRQGGISRS